MAVSTTYTSTSSVTGARIDSGTRTLTGIIVGTETVRLSSRPQITYMYPQLNLVPYAKAGYQRTFQVEGYNFKLTNISVYLSTNKGTYTSNRTMSSVSGINIFASVTGVTGGSVGIMLSALYPAFTGVQIPDRDWSVTTNNTMSFTLSAADAAGKADLIISNNSGYCTLTRDLSTRIIDILA